jgi:hypothetical protein
MREFVSQCRPLKALALSMVVWSATGMAHAEGANAPQFEYRLPIGPAPVAIDAPPPASSVSGLSALVLSASTLAFGDVERGSTAYSLAYSITNTGAPATFALEEPAAFRVDYITEGCADVTHLPTGAACVFVVRFEPDELRSYDRLIRWVDTGALPASGTGAELRVAGRGVAPAVALTDIEMGDVLVGQSTLAVATLSNQGTMAVTVTAPTAANVTGAGFTFIGTSCGGTLAPGGSCQVDVRFSPGAVQAVEGALRVDTDMGQRSALLAGRGVQGTSNPNPSAVAFGQFASFSTVTRQVRLFNLGNAPVTYSNIGIVASSSNFQQSNDCGTPVAPGGGSCVVTVSFTAAPGPQSGTLVAEHNGESGLTAVALSGAGKPLFQVSNADFGYLSPPAQRTNQVTVRNISTQALTLAGIGQSSLTGPFYLITGRQAFDNCSGQTLQPNQTCEVAIEWVVQDSDPALGSLRVVTTGGAVQLLGLIGNDLTATPDPGPGN